MHRVGKILGVLGIMVGLVTTTPVVAQDGTKHVIFKSDIVQSISAPERWTQEDRTWRYQTKSQTRLLLGNTTPQLSSGLRMSSIGGVGLADQWQSDLFSKTLQWRYGATVGLVDHSQDLYHFRYNTGAARAWFDVSLSPELSIDGVYQRTDDYEQLGLGTQYRLGMFGKWSLSMQHSDAGNQVKGQRYQGSVALDITDQMQVQLKGEHYNGRFVRLNQNRYSPTPEQQVYGAALQWDSDHWGRFQARYDNTVVNNGNPQQAIGLAQQLWYSSSIRVDLDAQRQTHTGDYNVGLRFSLPLF